MARGLPAVWSALFASPFIVGGIYFYFNISTRLIIRFPPSLVDGAGLGFDRMYLEPGFSSGAFGVFIILMGLYIQTISPSKIDFHDDEEIIDTRHPSQRTAALKIVTSLPFLIGAAYLLYFTTVPYVYPTVPLIIGLYFSSTGIKIYWENTLTTYHITTERVISEYRFFSLKRKELPLSKLRSVEENKSVAETIVGLGNVRLASGGGGGSVRLMINNIPNSTSFAAEIRDLTRE